MSVLNEKYKKLALTDEYLQDPLLLALAWKKAQHYVRTTSWYADNFEIDTTTIDLPNRCQDWSRELVNDLEFTPIELIPAPKGCKWEFKENEKKPTEGQSVLEVSLSEFNVPAECLVWKPSDLDKLKLRPLAHIGIREQTIMTLVMMCIANEVEAEQGDPATPFDKVHEKKVVSYGNRLYCQYVDEKAEHSYGATTVYSKYFTDYRQFLQRPYHFAIKELAEKSDDQEVYIVELDMKQFFDLVDRDKLAQKIEVIANRQESSSSSNIAARGNILQAFCHWKWSSDAHSKFAVCASDIVKVVPEGIPQGLVSGGFLSNVYLADFDKYMSLLTGSKAEISALLGSEIRIVDYCRYVDDMRLVIVGPSRKGCGVDPITAITSWLNEMFDRELQKINLRLNTDKTKVEVFRGKSVGISVAMQDIQSKMSGPVPLDEAGEYLGRLESLLTMAGSDNPEQLGDNCRINRLAAIERDFLDVREDTLKRFAANKISSLLSSIRHFTSRDVGEQGQPVPGEWDYLQERIARRFIACWSRDPSLVLLLKKGLELYPSPKLLGPILEQLKLILNKYSNSRVANALRLVATANYCLAEIFRHSATVIHRKDLQAIPAHADMNSFFEELQQFAVDIIIADDERAAEDDDSAGGRAVKKAPFNFLAEQARFLLMVRLDTTLELGSGNDYQDLIVKLTKGFRQITLPEEMTDREIAACILIASQLLNDQKAVIRATASMLNIRLEAIPILELIAMQDVALCCSLIRHARQLKYRWVAEVKATELDRRLYLDSRPSAKPLKDLNGDIPIYKLISRIDNPLANEVMALKLMLALIDKAPEIETARPDKFIDLAETKIEFSCYRNPPAFGAFDENLIVSAVRFHVSIANIAGHLHAEHDDTFVLQRIAFCLRAVLAGSEDPTSFGRSFLTKAGYRGLKSTQYKRQIGLMTTPEALAGESAEFSAWLTTLLSKLLRWPGIRVNDQGYDWPLELTLVAVKKLVDERLALLKRNYCELSRTPSLLELVNPAWSHDKTGLTVAMVQSKMPHKDDFSSYGILLDQPIYRAKHRQHVARVAELVIKHIEAQHLDKPKKGERHEDIDLIVWPELAVHKDDMDILVALSRKTHAIVFAGLSFIQQQGVKGPNNCAAWIVPRKHNGNMNEIIRYQGKHHMMEGERIAKVQPWRPYQLMLELVHPRFPKERGFVLTGAVCFDATDIHLSADLRDKSNALLIPALNRDVNTFDSMVEALHYHMYQHVVLVNTGEFGGSYAMAPYDKPHKRLIAHSTGNDQVAINTFEMNMFDFRRDGAGKCVFL